MSGILAVTLAASLCSCENSEESSAPEQSATVAQSDVDATTTSLPQTTVTTTAPVVTTTPEQVTTTTAATTKATEQKTTTTTKKVTTTTKKVTTTAKPKPVTTTKKVTTTAKTTTTTKPTAKLTQSDVNKLVKELQAYSTNKHFEINKERILAEIETYKNVLPEGYDWEDYKSEVISAIPTFTPSNSSWSPTTAIDLDYTYEQAYNFVKGAIDFEYATSPECHVVVYAKWCPNGQGATDGVQRSHWEVYCLR